MWLKASAITRLAHHPWMERISHPKRTCVMTKRTLSKAFDSDG